MGSIVKNKLLVTEMWRHCKQYVSDGNVESIEKNMLETKMWEVL